MAWQAQLFDESKLKMCHGLAMVDHQNLLGRNNNMNHWVHMCDMKVFGSNRYGVTTANNVSFGSGLGS
jgi:hypothetical protein